MSKLTQAQHEAIGRLVDQYADGRALGVAVIRSPFELPSGYVVLNLYTLRSDGPRFVPAQLLTAGIDPNGIVST